MSGPGGTRAVHVVALRLVSTVLAGSLAGCTYQDESDPPPMSAGPATTQWPPPTIPAKDPDVLALETRNYEELEKKLAASPGTVLLTDSGPVDGPVVGFRKAATVKTAGFYHVTVACVGTKNAQVALMQNASKTTVATSFTVECSKPETHIVQLDRGHVGTQLTVRRDPGAAWTGAVAGIKITAP